jgi:ABC-type sugar transport system permease subunit
MTKYSFFKKIIHSFYNKDVYIHVGKTEQKKIGLGYLLLLLCIFWIPLIIKVHIGISAFINTEVPPFIEKFPVVEIHDGVASFDKPSPYIIKDEKTGEDLIIFDDSGEYTSLENTEAKVLVTDSKLIYIKDKFETREYSFATIQDFSLTHEKIMSWMGWGNYISIFVFLLVIPCVFIYRALQVLLYSLAGLIFQSVLKTRFSFQTIYRLTILSITPAFVTDKVLQYFDLDFTGWTFLCMVISLCYLYFGMKWNKENDLANLSASPEFGANDSSSNSGIQ